MVDGEGERQDPLVRPVGVLHGHVRDDIAAVRILDGLQHRASQNAGRRAPAVEAELDLRLASGRRDGKFPAGAEVVDARQRHRVLRTQRRGRQQKDERKQQSFDKVGV